MEVKQQAGFILCVLVIWIFSTCYGYNTCNTPSSCNTSASVACQLDRHEGCAESPISNMFDDVDVRVTDLTYEIWRVSNEGHLKVIWNLPEQLTDEQMIPPGFEVRIQDLLDSQANNICATLNLTTATWPFNATELKLLYDCELLPGGQYSLLVTTLPRPNNTLLSPTAQLSIMDAPSGPGIENWTPDNVIQQDSCWHTISVTFPQYIGSDLPAGTVYRIILNNSSGKIVQDQLRQHDPTVVFQMVTFTNVTHPGEYFCKIDPCSNCIVTLTSKINIINGAPYQCLLSPTTAVIPTTPSDLLPTTTPTNHTSQVAGSTTADVIWTNEKPPKTLSPGQVAGVTVGVVAGLVLILIMAFCIHKTRHQDRPPDKDPYSTQEAVPLKGSILLVYSKDSRKHVAVVESFAHFLQHHLHYKVLLDQWCEAEVATDKWGWIKRSAKAADQIILINSTGTVRKMKEHTLITDLELTAFCSTGEMFVQSYKALNNLSPSFHKVSVITFSYSQIDLPKIFEKRNLPHYKLMDDIELLCEKLRSNQINGYLPQSHLHKDDYQQAILNLTNSVDSNPTDQNYTEEKYINFNFLTPSSIDSGTYPISEPESRTTRSESLYESLYSGSPLVMHMPTQIEGNNNQESGPVPRRNPVPVIHEQFTGPDDMDVVSAMGASTFNDASEAAWSATIQQPNTIYAGFPGESFTNNSYRTSGPVHDSTSGVYTTGSTHSEETPA